VTTGSSAPALLVLAAGMGTRYGGLKQMETVGPGGATLMDYAVFDALRSGFGSVAFVIRPEMEASFAAEVLPRFRAHAPSATVTQRLDAPPGCAVPPRRVKPWGTAHAVLAAADAIGAPFAVVNADDFYGREAYAAMGEFLSTPQADGPPAFALAGFRLARTVSAAGPVNRAVCRTGGGDWLESVVEVERIATDRDGGYSGEENGAARRFSGAELVSMNMWGFTPAVFPRLREMFRDFLRGPGEPDLTSREFLIPTAVQELIRSGAARVKVLPTDSPWTGITHPDDRPRVAAALREMVERGEYPERLWA